MKYILAGIVVLCMTYIGIGLSKFYSNRKRFFDDLILFCEKLCVDISFSKENLTAIISSCFENFSKNFKSVLENYLSFLKENGVELSSKTLLKKQDLLKEDEKEILILFFKNLGRLDACNQIEEINNFKQKFCFCREKAVDENKKFGALSLKLMLLFGALVVIILI